MKRAVQATLLLGALVAPAALTGSLYGPEPVGAMPKPVKVGDGGVLERIWHARAQTHECQVRLARPRSPVAYMAELSPSVPFRRWVMRLWQHRARYHCNLAGQVGNVRHWLCIHRGEGAWNANTGNGYFGGLQMDLQFQRTYGAALLASKGTADRWTPLEQMIVAERARRSGRGYWPWPNTARRCGLI